MKESIAERLGPAPWLPALAVLVVLCLRLLGAYLLPLVPNDTQMSAGPALGLLREGRLVDVLVFNQYPSYMGYPPLYQVVQLAWFYLFDIGVTSWFGLMLFNLALLGYALVLLGRRYSSSSIRVFVVVLIILSSGHWYTGRPDEWGAAFIIGSIISTDMIRNRPSPGRTVGLGVWLALAALTHPAVGWASAVGAILRLWGIARRAFLRSVLIAGCVSIALVMGVYLPIVLSDVETWRTQFIEHGIQSGRQYFSIGALAKFWALNLATAAAFFAVAVDGRRTGWWRQQPGRSLLIAIAVTVCLMPFGKSNYYVYSLPFWMIAVLQLWEVVAQKGAKAPEGHRRPSVAAVGSALAAAVALSLGPGLAIFQSLGRPEYRPSLLEARRVLREKVRAEDSILVDYQLLPAVVDYPNVRLLWHSWYINRTRDDLAPGTLVATSSEALWDKPAMKNILSRWDDTQEYDVVALLPQREGLPRVFESGHGDPMGLILVRKR